MKLFFNKRFIKSIAIVLIALLCFIQPASDYVNSAGTVKAAGTGTTSDTDESDQDATADSEATTSELPEDLPLDSEIDDDLIKEDTLNELTAALGKLPAELRDIIILRYSSNLPLTEIAERMHLSYGAVKLRHQKALDLLRKEMEQ
jgi:RNA polymerase sigma factor (sigma-70 family)